MFCLLNTCMMIFGCNSLHKLIKNRVTTQVPPLRKKV
jgi:hypothetical protein